MAFRQPTSFAPARRIPNPEVEVDGPLSPQKTVTSQEWVSRLSDFGSLNTVARSGQYEDEVLDDDEAGDEELDSLDDGLQAFREPSMYNNSRRADQSGESILPAHDGLGTFAASSTPVQEQLWNFEQHNPRRRYIDHQRRKSSVQRTLDTVGNDEVERLDNIRMERIEKWRLEQSEVLLAEIEKETRKRRLDRAREESKESIGPQNLPKSTSKINHNSSTSQSIPTPVGQSPTEDTESFLHRIARRVIRDFMGIDDSILSIIIGESLAADDTLSTTPSPRDSYLSPALSAHPPSEMIALSRSWEHRLLDRLARELGLLVHQLSDLSTPDNTSSSHSFTWDYAGIPIIEESIPLRGHACGRSSSRDSTKTPEYFQFTPTLKQRRQSLASASEHAIGWGIDAEENSPKSLATDVDYWEQTPDLKTVFGYLQRRLTSQQRSACISAKSNIATANTPDSLRRAAVIRQHHPLVSRSTRVFERHVRHNSFLLHHGSPHLSPSLKRAGTSCASLSTKKSRRDVSEGSRNYWDIGDSIGSGSAIATFGGMGGWGEV
ncbi:hypothetical protein MMC13_006562 [Lambiella insularis]|nr:hypothetical protein [Lambiella insularis]